MIAYAALHSLLATDAAKRRAARHLGSAYARVYVVVSTALLVPLFWLPRPPGTLCSVEIPLRWLLRFIQAVGVTGFIWTLRHFANGTFLGLDQIRTGATGPEDEPSGLATDGPFGWCRHPLYLFSTIALVASPTMSTFLATFTVWVVA